MEPHPQVGASEPLARNGFFDTLKFISYTVGAGALFYFALQYGSADNQYVRIALWVGFLLALIMSFGELFATLEDYNLHFLTMVSTWNMLLAAIAAVVLFFSRQGVASSDPFSTLDVVMIAIMLLFTLLALLFNMMRTNFIFGIILTLIQFVFSALLLLAAATIWNERHRHNVQ